MIRIPATLIVLILCFAVPASAAGQAAGSRDARGNQTLKSGLELLAAGETEAAVRLLSNLAGTSSNPALMHRAQCYAGAAMGMSGEIRPTEQLVAIINRGATSAPAEWNRMIADCVHELEQIAPRVPAIKLPGFYYYLGLIGTDESAHVRFLREAVRLRPDFGEAAYQLGVHLMADGQLTEAAALFQRVAEQHPEWAEPRANLGIVYNLTGRPAEAVQQLRDAIKVRPDYAEAHGQLGLALYVSGQYDTALDECARALREEPDNPTFYNCAAVILLEKNRNMDAIAYARRAAEMAPRHETFLIVYAAAQLANGQEPDAAATMSKAVALHPVLRTDPTRAEKADLLRGRALALVQQLLQKPTK